MGILMRFIIILLFITGCTFNNSNPNLNPKPKMCPKFYTYVCDVMGSRKDCYCANTRQLENILGLTR